VLTGAFVPCGTRAGDAETKPLSALSDALGSEQCSCYGITEVAQSDAVFQNISVAGGDMSVAYADPAGTYFHCLHTSCSSRGT
jgi:hypothetical protein